MSWAGMTQTGSLEESLSLASGSASSTLSLSVSGGVSTGLEQHTVAVSMPGWMAVSMPVSMTVFEPRVAKAVAVSMPGWMAVSMPCDCCCQIPGPVPDLRAQAAWRSRPRRMTCDNAAGSMAGPELSESDKGIYHNG
jgi:hypothetical protein